MEHLQQAFKNLDDFLGENKYFISSPALTYFDIIVYNELSQILAMYERYRTDSKSILFKKLRAIDPEWEQKSEIKKHINLTNWFYQTMPNSEAGNALKKYDKQFKNDLEEQIKAHINPAK